MIFLNIDASGVRRILCLQLGAQQECTVRIKFRSIGWCTVSTVPSLPIAAQTDKVCLIQSAVY